MAGLTSEAMSPRTAIVGTISKSLIFVSPEPANDSASASPLNPTCPQCGSKKLWRDAKRYTVYGDEIQRWLCRDCGLRFSDPNDVKSSRSKKEKMSQNAGEQ